MNLGRFINPLTRIPAAAKFLAAATLLLGFPGIELPGMAEQAPSQDIRNTYTPGTNTHFRFTAPATVEAWNLRREALRNQILAAAGLLPMFQKQQLHPERFGRLDRENYTVEKVLLGTFPGYYLGGNLYLPRASGKHPAVLLAHGHWPYGRLENESLCSPQSLAAALARVGFVVFMYDMVGYNDTTQTPHKFGGDSERLWSFGPLGLQLWNSIRSLDFVESLPEVEPSEVGIAGPSGGGTQTMLLTAVDDRVRFSVPINMVSAYMQGGDTCENAPALRLGTNNVEIAALAAPRPMFIVSATGDWTKHVPKEEFPEIRQVYGLYGKIGNVSVVQFDAPHNLNQQSREAVEQFLAGALLHAPNAERINEKGVQIEQLADMLALHGRALPTGALSYDGLFDVWREQSARQLSAISDIAQLRSILAQYLEADWPAKVTRIKDRGEDRIVLGREGVGDRVPAYYRRRGGVAILMVDADGAENGRKAVEAQNLASAGQSVLAIDAFGTGSARAPRNETDPHFLAFNLSDDQNRVQDILTSLRFLADEHCSKIELFATGKASWWAEFAAALAPAGVNVQLHVPDQSLVESEAAFLDNFKVPGILRAGGLRTADRLVKAREATRSSSTQAVLKPTRN